jgi:cytochrome P450 family 12
MKPRLVKSYIPLIDQIVNEFIANIPKIQDEKGEMPGNFHEYLNRWTLESITAITLEKRLGLTNFDVENELGMQVQRTTRKIFNMGMEFEMKPSVWKVYHTKAFKKLLQAFDDLTE